LRSFSMTATAQAIRLSAANAALPPQHTQKRRVPGTPDEAPLYPYSPDYANPETALKSQVGSPHFVHVGDLARIAFNLHTAFGEHIGMIAQRQG